MNFNQLKALFEVATRGTILRAAQHLNLSQPAVTKQIRALEDDLGCTLFQRKGRRLLPTSAVAELLPKIVHILQEVEDLRNTFRPSGAGSAQVIRVAAGRAISLSALPAAIEACRKRNPDLKVQLSAATPTAAAIPSLRMGTLHMIVASDSIGEPDLHFEPLLDDELVLITHEKHKLAKGAKPVSLSQIRNEQIIVHHYARYIENALRKAGISTRETILGQYGSTLPNTETITAFVARDQGVSVVPNYLVRMLNPDKLAIRRIRPQLPIQLGYYTLRTMRLSPIEKEFIGDLRAALIPYGVSG